MSRIRSTILERRGASRPVRVDLDEAGTIVIRPNGEGPLDPVQLREMAAAALAERPDAAMRIDLTGSGQVDAALLSVIAQCWLATSARERELVVIPGDPTDRPVLERMGFDDFYRVTDAA